ncbi:MAG: hypothetical protein A2289_10265 [Deltaproteobacteria bacterium RIFOXYA12_FULL_58_15]|nr:MAG: hypothetical protein A2289_10265 [Deltaproteobacteria bacterium RIFOXYA12_FULL_58_15]OGR12574.1 MAG: hypothetical protein A2341_15135 [Deltaproteobacteria bacterium RIFOXYB12_FULL_58_9]
MKVVIAEARSFIGRDSFLASGNRDAGFCEAALLYLETSFLPTTTLVTRPCAISTQNPTTSLARSGAVNIAAFPWRLFFANRLHNIV